MSATNRFSAGWPRFQAGVVMVEFGLLVAVFLAMVFGIIEIARIMYIFNAVQEVTRRAASDAATSNFSDPYKTATIRWNAVFRTSAGELVFGSPVSDQNVRIDYLALTRQSNGSTTMTEIPTASLPSCPGRNRQICMSDPNASNCIRFVRARVCSTASGAQCDRLIYGSFTELVSLPVKIPSAPTIVPAESLGFLPGVGPCS